MHAFLHGIRRSFLQPVWAPLQRCLPLLALLKCCPEDGDLLPFPIVNQPFGYGDLLQSGDEDEGGDLLPTKGDEDEADDTYLQPEIEGQNKGDLPPLSGEDSQQEGSSLADVDHMDLQPHLHGGQDEEEAELNLQSAPIDGQHQDVGDLLPIKGDDKEVGKSLIQTNEAMDKNLTKDGGAFQAGRISNNCKKLQNWYAYDVQLDIKDDDGLVEPLPHQFPPWVMPIPRPHVKMKANICVYTTSAHSRKHDGWASTIYSPHYDLMCMSFSPSSTSKAFHPDEYGHDRNPQHSHHVPYSIILAINFSSRAFLSAAVITNSPNFTDSTANEDNTSLLLLLHILRGSVYGEDDVVPYGCSLWLNGRHSRGSATTHFLIPLRGSISVQWNDEDFDKDVVALKMKTKRRMTVLRLLYLMKDLLDPG